MIRVLIADDSACTRELLSSILRVDPELWIVGEARDGVEAIEMAARFTPDVIVMDLRMPRMDGLDATQRIMRSLPTPIVIVSATLDARATEIATDAQWAGAVAVVTKPPGPRAPGFADACRAFVGTIKAMAHVKVVRRWMEATRSTPPFGAPGPVDARPRVVGVAASTGGPTALRLILSELPRCFPAPILIVQHIADGFSEGFAAWLDGATALTVKLAEQGEPLARGTVYLAPRGVHLGTSPRIDVALSTEPPVEGFRPSATHLFESLSKTFGTSTLAMILTGMGTDGVEGLRAVRLARGRVIAQDEASSAVFGMPAAAIAAGLADQILPLNAISSRLIQLTLDDVSARSP